MNLRHFRRPAQHRRGIAVFLAEADHLVHVFGNVRITLQIALDEFLGLSAADIQLLGQAEIGNAVDDPEVDGFGLAAMLRVNLIERNLEHVGRSFGMNIDGMPERVQQPLLVRHVRQHS